MDSINYQTQQEIMAKYLNGKTATVIGGCIWEGQGNYGTEKAP